MGALPRAGAVEFLVAAGGKRAGPGGSDWEIWTANGKDFPEGLERLRTVKS